MDIGHVGLDDRHIKTEPARIEQKRSSGEMVFMETTFTCSGCGKERKGFAMGPFKLHVRDDRKVEEGEVYQYDYCNMACLKKWAKTQ